MSTKIIVLLLTFLMVTLQVQSQDIKNEKEKYVDRNVFPDEALKQLDALSDTKRISYIRQVDGDNVSFEAKFKFNNMKLSVEFAPGGRLQDIEVLIKKRDLPDGLYAKFDQLFLRLFDKYKITRMQRQYKPGRGYSGVSLNDYLENSLNKFKINYELELRVVEKNSNEIGHYEFLIDENAEIQRKRRIKKVIDDNEVY
ncbi:hypothetical protein L21SP5_03281 [Salinivirga cyanobacteriivorans]|uniref:Uncharacterized protein n=1 Tax=Salinivirga cyanobacteriivorans TaxID=1307839 RepID=A0A0S2I3J4_9BACT|nr:hypothetical protein [Salinivirga cyanobacteriivorans]ALO16895.1 hypothetical protein L21SP5_03281 [Salinivirga cyanobacteriivorans]